MSPLKRGTAASGRNERDPQAGAEVAISVLCSCGSLGRLWGAIRFERVVPLANLCLRSFEIPFRRRDAGHPGIIQPRTQSGELFLDIIQIA